MYNFFHAPQNTVALGEFTQASVCVRAFKLRHYSFIKTVLSQTIQTSRHVSVCLFKPLKQYKENLAVQFQILSLHHVNKLRVKQCSHHCQWVMVNDVDVAVDTPPVAGL